MSIYNNPRPGAFITLWVAGVTISLAFWLGFIYAAARIIRAVFA